MANYTTIDCCPVDTRLYPVLKELKAKTGCTYQSIYRGSDPKAQKYLTGGPPCYKHNQAWIYAHYPPGVANPPGRSTHERRNDGVAYRGPVGMWLPWWCCGIDVDDAHVASLIREAAKLGYTVTITYPNSRVEYHHVNFRKAPKVKPRALRFGSKGPRVRTLTRRLAYVYSPKTGKPYLTHKYWTYTRAVEQAVKQFQKDHHQKADGIAGTQTLRQLDRSVRWAKKHRK